MPTKPTREARASRSKKNLASLNQTHAALPPEENAASKIQRAFGIRDAYNGQTFDQYSTYLKGLSSIQLHDHAYAVQVTPVNPRERLVTILERKFQETRSRALPIKVIPLKVDPKMAEWHKNVFMAKANRV